MIGSKRALLRAIAALAAAPLMGAAMRGAAAQASHRQGAKAMKIYLAGPLGFSEAGSAVVQSCVEKEKATEGPPPPGKP